MRVGGDGSSVSLEGCVDGNGSPSGRVCIRYGVCFDEKIQYRHAFKHKV